MNRGPLKIAVVGTKGVPAKWGGIETYIEQIGRRLAARGHRVTVFGSKWYCADFKGTEYRRMRIRRVPTLRTQATDALTNAFFASRAVVRSDDDIVHFHGLASYAFVPYVRAAGKITVTTTHAMESNWENTKYNRLGRWVIRQAFMRGIRRAHRTTTVARHLQEKMKGRYGVEPVLLPSGLDPVCRRTPDIIRKKHGLHGGDYLLFLGRIDPIKRIDWVLDLLTAVGIGTRLVIAGGAQDPTTAAYLNRLEERAAGAPGIVFTGPVAGEEKDELFSNCLALLAPSADEGLPLTLLEAAAYEKCCIASDIAAFRAVIDDGTTGFLFPADNRQAFVSRVKDLLQTPQRMQSAGRRARQKWVPLFDWDNTVNRLEILYYQILTANGPQDR
jgi:glycosyltransferase involved in cell wall biosynthesis